jgi:hypothetical protein
MRVAVATLSSSAPRFACDPAHDLLGRPGPRSDFAQLERHLRRHARLVPQSAEHQPSTERRRMAGALRTGGRTSTRQPSSRCRRSSGGKRDPGHEVTSLNWNDIYDVTLASYHSLPNGVSQACGFARTSRVPREGGWQARSELAVERALANRVAVVAARLPSSFSRYSAGACKAWLSSALRPLTFFPSRLLGRREPLEHLRASAREKMSVVGVH